MPRVSDQYKQDRIHSLYLATWACIAQKGLQGLTLDDVISASGYTAGMVYNYFGSRDELVAGASAAALTQLKEAFDEAVSLPTQAPADFFVAVLDAFDRKAVNEPFAMAAASTIMNSRPHIQDPDPEVSRRYRAFRNQVEEHASRWRETGSVGREATPREIAELMISLLMGYFGQYPLLEIKSRDGHLAALAAISSNSNAASNTP